jgi:hypothetical protein
VYGQRLGVKSVPKTGGPVTVLTWAPVTALAFASGRVYWAEQFALRSIPVSGGEVTTISESAMVPSSLFVDGDVLYVAQDRLGVAPDYGSIASVPTTGGELSEMAVKQPYPRFLVVDGGAIYWVNEDLGTNASPASAIMKMSKAGGSPRAIASIQGYVAGMALDATCVYWIEDVDKAHARLMRIGK